MLQNVSPIDTSAIIGYTKNRTYYYYTYTIMVTPEETINRLNFKKQATTFFHNHPGPEENSHILLSNLFSMYKSQHVGSNVGRRMFYSWLRDYLACHMEFSNSVIKRHSVGFVLTNVYCSPDRSYLQETVKSADSVRVKDCSQKNQVSFSNEPDSFEDEESP